MTDRVLWLRCSLCSTTYPDSPWATTCPTCGPAGTLDVELDYERIAMVWSAEALDDQPPGTGMWRYAPLLPIPPEPALPPVDVGGTPLYDLPRLASAIGVNRLLVKDEGRQPTASLKDRASAMAVVKAAEAEAPVITTASTGNAAAALAGMCAAVGTRCVIFVPQSAPEAKVVQLLVYGATVVLVEGSYGDAFDLSMEAAAAYGWYNRNTGINPFMTEGKKTVAHEIADQMRWEPPDAVFVGVGDGSIIGGVHQGFTDLMALGWIDRMPRLFGVQAAGSAYLAEAFESGEDVAAKAPIAAETVADSISADLPRDRVKAMRAVQHTAGAFLAVPDEAILDAVAAQAAAGVFSEPAAAAPYAGALAAADAGLIGGDDTVVLISTGSGLKDVAAARRAMARTGATPLVGPPDLDALRAALGEAPPER